MTDNDTPACSRCNRWVRETADCRMSRGRPAYLCSECLEGLREDAWEARRDESERVGVREMSSGNSEDSRGPMA